MNRTIQARVYRPTPRNLAYLAQVLAKGGLVAAPTETVYGLAADALNAKACRAIFRAKGRPADDPLIVHVDSLAQAGEVALLNDAAIAIAKMFWPGPLTLILPKRDGIPAIVTSGLPSVAVRMPAHPLFRELIRLSGRPLAAPSANPFGYVSPTTAGHVRDGLGLRIGHILDGGPSTIGVESTILDLRDPKHPALLRPGAVSREALERVLGRKVTAYRRKVAPKTASVAPGLLERHYSPRTPLSLSRTFSLKKIRRADAQEAWLFVRKPAGKVTAGNIFWLSDAHGGLAQAAHRLFGRLRALDGGGWSRLHAQLVPGNSALALAINDRLTRAAAKR
ncbi:MAG TPA: L-threonylcarbamoyladenylate synthase [Rariglobus sp.]